MACPYKITKGKRKGEICGLNTEGGLCYEHSRCKPSNSKDVDADVGSRLEQEGFVDKMPMDVLEDVCLRIAALTTRCNIKRIDSSLKTLGMLGMTCRTLRQTIYGNDAIWNQCWNTYVEAFPAWNDKRYLSIPVKERLLLCVYTGCQFCKRPRVRKIYHEFGVRCCTDCFYARTVRDFKLRTDYGVTANMLDGLRMRETMSYHHALGTYPVKCYWRADVEEHLGITMKEA